MPSLQQVRNQIAFLRRHPAYRGPLTIARLVAWEVRAAAHLPAVVSFGAGKFYCPPERRGMAKLAYIFRDQYEGELAMLGRVVRPGMTVLDIGAHYGTYALELARLVGPEGLVVAVEPSWRAVAVLERNLSLNDCKNVVVMHAAVSDKEGEMDLHIHPDPSRTSLADTSDSLNVEMVRTVTLDMIREEVRRQIDFVKIDIEGAEAMAFAGGPRVLAGDQPVVLFESAPEAEQRLGLTPGSGWRTLQGYGYNAFRLHSDQAEMVNPLTYVENVFAAPAGRLT